MSTTIPTHRPDNSFVNSVGAPTGADERALVRDQAVGTAPTPVRTLERTQAPIGDARTAASQQPSVDLFMGLRLRPDRDYDRATAGGVSFADALRVTASFLTNEVARREATASATVEIERARRLIDEVRHNSATVDRYTRHTLIAG